MKTKQSVLAAMFFAIMLLFALTPLGFIQIGPIKATLLHIPVIIGSIILGPKIGGFLGFSFGLFSLVTNTVTPSPLSFVFSPFYPVYGTDHGSLWALVIVFVPRILVGILPFFIYHFLQRKFGNKKDKLSLFMTGLTGSLINTILVMNLIFFLFQGAYANLQGVPAGLALYKAILMIILINGVPEALIAGIATSAVTKVLLKLEHKNNA